jgi:hypothetical protein
MDDELKRNSSVHGARFISDLNDVRRALNSPAHQFLAYGMFIDGMKVTKFHNVIKTPLNLYCVSTGERITAALIPTIEVIDFFFRNRFIVCYALFCFRDQ